MAGLSYNKESWLSFPRLLVLKVISWGFKKSKKIMNENYWKKENPEYIKILCEIETIECRIESGIITNGKTLKYKKRDLKKLYTKLREVKRYLE